MHLLQADVRWALQAGVEFCYLRTTNHHHHHHHHHHHPIPSTFSLYRSKDNNTSFSLYSYSFSRNRPWNRGSSVRPMYAVTRVEEVEEEKPAVCTADELHYVPVPGTNWRLSLWRYTPLPEAPVRNHPLMLLSGVGTNAIGFDLSPVSSFARYMSKQGFDTWIVELRGAGLSKRKGESKSAGPSADNIIAAQMMESLDKEVVGLSSVQQNVMDVDSYALLDTEELRVKMDGSETRRDESVLVTKLSETFMRLSERLSGFLNEGQARVISAKLFDQISKILEDAQLYERFNEVRGKISGLLEANQNSTISSQIRELSRKLVNILEEGQRSVSPPFYDLQERLSTTIEDFQKQLDLIVKYDWDFDNYLAEDVPAAMDYIRAHSKPKDGKLLAIGHSMGGILLYAILSRCGFAERSSELAAIVTIGSSLDYTTSNSSLKLLLPLADPAQALNVPVVPLGALMVAAYPLCSRPPYVLSWLTPLISSQDMMHPELLEKLVLNNFCTIPAKLLLQLTTAFRYRGLRDRSGTFYYKDHLPKYDVPVLAIAGDKDLICPPEAVYETVKLIPPHIVTYKVFGEPDGPHFAHYDLVGGRLAADYVYPCIVEFLVCHDQL
ncbi:uncharacterized protein LOC18433607 isoform X1 [Amborella trichopoda]|uniref:uncharacterized protein LOC18433607 isoform X1 n=1 Tax=Amborella trichopoda TaxID=13333 RepID=UPI0009C08DA9|nr:uncharacterized protein LOC18433607 isoform X1 [Amborella trichopoda]XP_020522371.1 uncharacterized protein LOC18433607 isoform X1 [Amborella trichopoda]|eukprot:XP_020522370.1 uncharacterized protein LOC18433607 isoform X1 [Amborella trichopoda]